jgi:hypothetical protein
MCLAAAVSVPLEAATERAYCEHWITTGWEENGVQEDERKQNKADGDQRICE